MNSIKKDTVLYSLTCVIVLVLFVSKYIILGCAILSVLLVYQGLKKGRIKVSKIHLFFLGFILINILQTAIMSSQNAIEEIQRNIIYILVCLLMTNIRIPYKNAIIVWRAMIVLCLSIQVMQLFKIGNVNTFLTAFYGESMFSRQSNYELLGGFRSGSIFMSINPYFKFTAMCLCFFMYDVYISSYKKNIKWLYVVLSLISTFLIGSRTGFLIIIVMFAYWVLYYVKNNISRDTLIKLVFGMIAVLILGVVLGYRYNIFDARFFKLSELSSLDVKVEKIEMFLTESSYEVILLGNGAYSPDSYYRAMDSDIGYILSYYGVFGLIFYISMLIYTVRLTKSSNQPHNKLFSSLVGIAVFLSIITSGVYMNYRVYSIILICIISYMNAIDEEELKALLDGGSNEILYN